MISTQEYKDRLALSLEDKVRLSEVRIQEWYERHKGKVYVAFSGGKDSTVLLHLVRSLYPEVPAVFWNTGLEFPEILQFVRTFENVEWVKPKMAFQEVIKKYGWPVVSKKVARTIRSFSKTQSPYFACRLYFGNHTRDSFKLSNKWRKLLYAPFKISDQCCDIMKKRPAKTYSKKTGRVAFVGEKASDSTLRQWHYLDYGCNRFDIGEPKSLPLSVWKDVDIWAYLKGNNIPYCSVYDMGYHATGCIFCGFGVQQEEKRTGTNRFKLLEKTHPKLWKYCMDTLGMREVSDYIR